MKYKTITEYDNYLENNISYYTVTKYLGFGKYQTTKYSSIEDARNNLTKFKKAEPNGRFLIYGISTPKDKLYPISIPMA